MKKAFNNNRSERIASAVQKHVAEILQDLFADDPTVSRVSVVDAESHGGLQHAKIFYYLRPLNEHLALIEGGSSTEILQDHLNVQKRLDDITPTVRFELGARMNQKYVPTIRFVYDDTLERGSRIDELLSSL
jgi:ribosome-binding factor A